MSVFKVVARDPKTGKQGKKKVYVGDAFKKYSEDLIKRWNDYSDIEIYTLTLEDEWKLWYKLDKPRTEEEAKDYQLKRGYSDGWYEGYIKHHL